MSDTAEIVELRRVRPVKWSVVDKKAGKYRHRLVGVFLEYEGRPLLEEDGTSILDPRGSPLEVSARSFAQRYGIPPSTFGDWVREIRGVTQPHQNRYRDTSRSVSERDSEPSVEGFDTPSLDEHHGQCSHCPDFPEGR